MTLLAVDLHIACQAALLQGCGAESDKPTRPERWGWGVDLGEHLPGLPQLQRLYLRDKRDRVKMLLLNTGWSDPACDGALDQTNDRQAP
jgi:hypothetical protein